MRLFLAALLFIGVSVTSFTRAPTPETRIDLVPWEARIDILPQGCVIASAEYRAALVAKTGLAGYRIWSRIVRVTYRDNDSAHAMLVFAMPKSGKVFLYDVNKGTTPLGTSYQNYWAIFFALRRYDENIAGVYWLD